VLSRTAEHVYDETASARQRVEVAVNRLRARSARSERDTRRRAVFGGPG
jgi:hypothetical protein